MCGNCWTRPRARGNHQVPYAVSTSSSILAPSLANECSNDRVGGPIKCVIPNQLDAEIDALNHFAHLYDNNPEAGRTAALDQLPVPYLIGHQIIDQKSNHWIPRGYLIIIVMSQKAGKVITDDEYLAAGPGVQKEMHQALVASHTKVRECRVLHMDPCFRNLLWVLDKSPVQCNIIDFEGAMVLGPKSDKKKKTKVRQSSREPISEEERKAREAENIGLFWKLPLRKGDLVWYV